MTKTCKRCHLEKPTSEFHRWKYGRDGLQDWCKECRKVQADKTSEVSKQRLQRRYQENKESYHKQSTAWAKANPERRKEIYTASANRNRDRVRQQKLASWHRNYEKNKLQIYENVRRRRARKKNAPGCGLTPAEWQALKVEHNFCCAYCKRSEAEIGALTQDHKIPLVRGGAHEYGNILPACRSCNSRKRTRTSEEFLRSQAS